MSSECDIHMLDSRGTFGCLNTSKQRVVSLIYTCLIPGVLLAA